MRSRIHTLLACTVALASCGRDQIAGGDHSGTETGNAIQATLLRPDGSHAAFARVAARPASSRDTSGTIWFQADSQGRVAARLAPGDWTLESLDSGITSRTDLRVTSDTILPPDTLSPSGNLEGTVTGSSSGQILVVVGLGRRCALDSRGGFRFAALPSGSHPIQLAGTASSWNVQVGTGRTDSVLLDSRRPGEIFAVEGSATATPGALPSLIPLPSPGPTWNIRELEWTDATGSQIAALPLRGTVSGSIQAWALVPSDGIIHCRRVVSGRVRHLSPFRPEDGFRMALAFPASGTRPDTTGADSVADLSGSSASIALWKGGGFVLDPAEGWIRRIPMGNPLLRIPSAVLPSGAPWTISVRAGLEQPEIGRIWLLDWSGTSASNGLKVGIGAGRLELAGHGIDTSIAVEGLERFSSWSVDYDGATLRIARDGHPLLSRTATQSIGKLGDCLVGTGGGIRLSHLFVLDRTIPPDSNAWGAPETP